jgi:hypothetical protein
MDGKFVVVGECAVTSNATVIGYCLRATSASNFTSKPQHEQQRLCAPHPNEPTAAARDRRCTLTWLLEQLTFTFTITITITSPHPTPTARRSCLPICFVEHLHRRRHLATTSTFTETRLPTQLA